MKTKINKLSIIVLASILLLFGCSKDFLDTKPKGVIPQQDFYKTDKDGTEAVMACYNMLQAFYSTPWQNVWMLKALASGDLYSGGAKQDDQPAADEINQFKYESNNAIIRDTYSQAYYIIYRANMIIDNFADPMMPIKKRLSPRLKQSGLMHISSWLPFGALFLW